MIPGMQVLARLVAVAVAVALTVLVVGPGPALAGTCTLTDFTTGQTLTADRLNGRLNQTEACINGQIGNGNWNTSEKLAVTNLANPNSYQYVTVRDVACNAGANTAIYRVPVASTAKGISVRCRGCDGTSAMAVTLQVDSTTVVAITGIAVATTQVSFGGSTAVSTTAEVNLDVSGTVGACLGLDIMIALTSPHQP